MSDFSLIGGGASALEIGYDYTTTTPTVISSSATAHTLGSFVELVTAANNTIPSTSVEVICALQTTSGFAGLMFANVAIGEAGSEQIIFPNLLMAAATTGQKYCKYDFPVSIPSGVRISVNIQSEITGVTTFGISMILNHGSLSGDPGLSVVDDIGANTGTTRGVKVDTSGTPHDFGSWVEITSSTDEAYKGFLVGHAKATGSWSVLQLTFDLGVGSAGNEEIIFSGEHCMINSSEEGQALVSGFIPVGTPKGVRLAIRAQSDKANPDKNFDYIFYGVR